MSDADALMTAVRNAIRTALVASIPTGKDAMFVDLTAMGEPPPIAGEWFVSVHDGECRQITPPGGYYQEAMYGLTVTFSERCAVSPEDRLGLDRFPALRQRMTTALSYLTNNPYTVMTAANALLDLTATNGFIEYLKVETPQVELRRQNAKWFKAHAKTEKATSAVSASVRLGGAKRIQAIGGVN